MKVSFNDLTIQQNLIIDKFKWDSLDKEDQSQVDAFHNFITTLLEVLMNDGAIEIIAPNEDTEDNWVNKPRIKEEY